mgnify:CR=1 FL=1
MIIYLIIRTQTIDFSNIIQFYLFTTARNNIARIYYMLIIIMEINEEIIIILMIFI